MRRRDSGYGGINYSMNPIDFVERFKSESNDLSVSVSCTRHDSKHVLHAEGDASPVMRLDFGHRYYEIGFQHGARKPEIRRSRVARA